MWEKIETIETMEESPDKRGGLMCGYIGPTTHTTFKIDQWLNCSPIPARSPLYRHPP